MYPALFLLELSEFCYIFSTGLLVDFSYVSSVALWKSLFKSVHCLLIENIKRDKRHAVWDSNINNTVIVYSYQLTA